MRATKTTKAYELKVLNVREVASMECNTPDTLCKYWKDNIATADWFSPERENMVVVLLNTRLVAIGHSIVSIGTLSQTTCHARDVFRAAIAKNAYAVAIMHNHPSGNPAPSNADRHITKQLLEAGELLQIRLIDHVVIGDSHGSPVGNSSYSSLPSSLGNSPYFSFREAGLI